jgi:TPR repeat protein
MKKPTKILLLTAFLASSLFSEYTIEEGQSRTSLEKFNRVVEKEQNPWIKQMLICEREWTFYAKTGDVNKCLKAADMVLALKGKNLSERELSFTSGNDENSINKQASDYFNSAGLIYGEQGDFKNKIKMYEKAASLGSSISTVNLGLAYHYGRGVQKNHIKAFEYYKKALQLGSPHAQNQIQMLCKESPWACK